MWFIIYFLYRDTKKPYKLDKLENFQNTSLSFKTLEDQATIFLSFQRSFYIPSSVKNEYQSSKKIRGERLLNIKIEEQRPEAVL
jgi:hypothetical protein